MKVETQSNSAQSVKRGHFRPAAVSRPPVLNAAGAPGKTPALPSRAKPVVPLHEIFSRFARTVSALSSHPMAFMLAVFGVLAWAICGPMVGYSETWQLWINTSTTILTFLMVFLLQHAQSRDVRALQLKLDELLRAVTGARNELINLEDVSEEELERYCHEFKDLHLKYAQILEKKGKKIGVQAESLSIPAESPPTSGSD